MVHLLQTGASSRDSRSDSVTQEKIYTLAEVTEISYIPDSAKPVRQKEVADMLSMISYAEENGEKKAKTA